MYVTCTSLHAKSVSLLQSVLHVSDIVCLLHPSCKQAQPYFMAQLRPLQRSNHKELGQQGDWAPCTRQDLYSPFQQGLIACQALPVRLQQRLLGTAPLEAHIRELGDHLVEPLLACCHRIVHTATSLHKQSC